MAAHKVVPPHGNEPGASSSSGSREHSEDLQGVDSGSPTSDPAQQALQAVMQDPSDLMKVHFLGSNYLSSGLRSMLARRSRHMSDKHMANMSALPTEPREAHSQPVGRIRKPKKKQELMLKVIEEEEALVAFQQQGRPFPSNSSQSEATGNTLKVHMRIPLLMAKASQDEGDASVVTVSLPSSETLNAVKGMNISPGEAHSLFQEPRIVPDIGTVFTFGCASERDAQKLLKKLSAAGCILRGLTNRYRLRKEVGRGGFGRVYLAHDLWKGEEVAVKVFLNNQPRENLHPLREATMLRWAKDPLFPTFEAVYQVLESEFEELGLMEEEGIMCFALVTEYLPGGELFAFLGRHGPLPEECAQAVMRQVFEGLRQLHNRGVMHRDIKTENILLAGDGNKVKLVDFGLACPEWDTQAATARVGSVGCLAPEVLCQPAPPQSTKVDIFSAGILMYCCLIGHGPFQGKTVKEMLLKNLHNRISVESLARSPKGARELLVKLLDSRPEARPTAEEVLQHEWLQAPRDDSPEPKPPADAETDSNEQIEEKVQKGQYRSECPSTRSCVGGVGAAADSDGEPGSDSEQDTDLSDFSNSRESLTLAVVKQVSKRSSNRSDAPSERATAGDLSDQQSSLSLLGNGSMAGAAGTAAPTPPTPPDMERTSSRPPTLRGARGPRAGRPSGGGAFAARVLRVHFTKEQQDEQDDSDSDEEGCSALEQTPNCLQEIDMSQDNKSGKTDAAVRAEQRSMLPAQRAVQQGGSSSNSSPVPPATVPAAVSAAADPVAHDKAASFEPVLQERPSKASNCGSERSTSKYACADDVDDDGPLTGGASGSSDHPGAAPAGETSERLSSTSRLNFRSIRQRVAESRIVNAVTPRFFTAGRRKNKGAEGEQGEFDFLPLVP